MGFASCQLTESNSESVFFPFTSVLRRRIRAVLFAMTAIACFLAIVLREHAFFVLGGAALLSDAPFEVLFLIARRRMALVLSGGELLAATVVRKRTFPIGPQHAVLLRYSTHGTIVESSRQVPYEVWLPLHAGDLLHIRVDRERPRNWVLCGPKEDSDLRDSGSRSTLEEARRNPGP